MNQEPVGRKQYPSECLTEDPRRLETQIRVFKRWLNCLLKQANAREVDDVLDLFRDTENLCSLCKHLLNQKAISIKEPFSDGTTYLDRAIAMLERLYGHELATVIQTVVAEISSKQVWDSEALLRDALPDPSKSTYHNLLLLGLDAIWILIVTVRAGTGPPTNLTGSISSSGSTITRRSLTAYSGSQSHSVNLTSARTPCMDRWLQSQDERLMAWCLAETERYHGINVTNFTHSWRDGLAFLAIVHQCRPDLFSYDTRLEKTANQNLSLVFHMATAEFAVPRLLEPIDMHPDNVEPRATAAYVLEFRKAVERDKKRRSRGILEIQTASMNPEHQDTDQECGNVAVLSQSSPTSTASASDVTWLDDEFDDDSDKGEEPFSSLPDPDLFDSMMETTLAWLLAMEERFAQNDLNSSDAICQPDYQFSWANYCRTDVRGSSQHLNQLTLEERNDIESLLNFSTERLKKLHQKVLVKVDEAMAHFEVHEDLTAHLSRRQMNVGRCLRLGNRIIQTCRDRSQLQNLINSFKCTGQEEQVGLGERLVVVDQDAIQRQTSLLASRWNNLCRINQTMSRRMTNCLLRRQGMLLIAIRLQLEKLEADQVLQSEISLGPTIRELKNQLEANRILEQGIEAGEILAARLDNFIMLVPSRGTEKKNDEIKTEGLEATLTDLANRWGRLVEWVNTRYAKLQNALLHWRHFEEEANVLGDWLTERTEEIISVVKAARTYTRPTNRTVPSPSALSSKSGSLKRDCSGSGERRESLTNDVESIENHVHELLESNDDELEAMENYIAHHEPQWSQLLASLDRRAHAVREACGDSEEVSRTVEAIVDRFLSQWSQLAEPQMCVEDWINQFAREEPGEPSPLRPNNHLEQNPPNAVPLSHFSPSTVPTSQSGLSEQSRSDVLLDRKRPAEVFLGVPRSPKLSSLDVPPPSPTGYRAEFESKAEELLNWLENGVEALELITMDKNRALEATKAAQTVERRSTSTPETHTEKPSVVIERIARETYEWRETMKRVLTMGERYREELLEAGENIEELDQLFDEVEERWGYLDSLLAEAQRQIRVASNSKRFHQEVAKLLSRPEETNAVQPAEVDLDKTTVNQELEGTSSPGSPTESLNSTLVQLENQLSRVEEEMATGSLLFSDSNELDKVLINTKNMINDLLDENSRLVSLVSAFNGNLKSETALDSRVTSVTQRLQTACTQLQTRTSAIQEVGEQTEFFMNQLEGVEKWLSDMRDYLDSVSQAVLPSVTVIQAQLLESCEALKDMDTLEPTMMKVNEVAKQLAGYFRSEYVQIINSRLEALHNNWMQVRQLTQSNRDQLESRIAEGRVQEERRQRTTTDMDSVNRHSANQADQKSSSLPELAANSTVQVPPIPLEPISGSAQIRVNTSELARWMDEAKDRLAKLTVIRTQEDLGSMKDVVKSLTQEITEKRYILAALDSHTAIGPADRLLSDTETLLTRARFTDLESALASERERLRGALYYLEDFNTVMSGEKRWFDSLASAMSRLQTTDYNDVAELSDDLESLDRLMDEHTTEDEERLDSLVKSLTTSNVMAEWVLSELKLYKESLSRITGEVSATKTEAKTTLDLIRDTETKTDEWEVRLKALEAVTREKLNLRLVPNDGSTLLKDCADVRDEAEAYLTNVQQSIDLSQGSEPLKRLLRHLLQACYSRVQESLRPVKQLLDRMINSADLEPRMIKMDQKLDAVEKLVDLLNVTSALPMDIQSNTEKAKDLLTSLNEIKTELDQISKKLQLAENGTHPGLPMNPQTEVTALQERHHKAVMSILLTLGRLEDILPLANRLDDNVKFLYDQVAGIEEMIDYLETTDCSGSRSDMIKRIYQNLENLCNPKGIVEEISGLIEKMRPMMSDFSRGDSSDSFATIEERIERVVATKEAFRQQLEQDETHLGPHPSDEIKPLEVSRASDSPTSIPVAVRTKPTVSQLIEMFLNPETPVSHTVREMACEIRDHFKSIVLFNRYCLGRNTPLASNDVELSDVKSHLLETRDYETTVSERKAIVQHFRQQRTYLGDRLRQLIVNAGDDGTDNRLQDLLNLQTAWQETNEKLDRRGEQMATLDEQLTAAEEAMIEYQRTPTDGQLTECVSLIKRLEETYGWKLSTDLERLKQISDGQISPQTRPGTLKEEGDRLLRHDQLGLYESALETVARNLNDIQLWMDLCNHGSSSNLAPLLGPLEEKFTDCYRILADAAELLHKLTDRYRRTSPTKSVSADSSKPDELEAEDLIWLKILLDTQRYRLNAFSLEFKANKTRWKQLTDQWETFCSTAAHVKSLISELHDIECDLIPVMEQNFREKLTYACRRFCELKHVGTDIIQSDLYPPESRNGAASSDESVTVTLPKPEHTEALPAKCGLSQITALSHAEQDRQIVQTELNSIHGELLQLCKRYHHTHLLESPTKQPQSMVYPVAVTDQPLQPVSDNGSGAAHDDWMDSESSALPPDVADALGSYRNDVEACLQGLNEEAKWLITQSGLVPSSLLKRHSDDILLTTASKPKPTTMAELRLDVAFWHSLQSESVGVQQVIEFSPSWLKTKWADLEALIELTFEHEKQANTWCRKSAHITRLLRENDVTGRTSAIHAKTMSMLESSCNRMAEALIIAQTGLKRRKACLTRWQSDLVELDTILAEIKTWMTSYEVTGVGIQKDSPSAWLSELRQRLLNSEISRNFMQEHLLLNFDSSSDGLRKYLTALSNTWMRVRKYLSQPEQSIMMIRVPEYLSTQIESLLHEWDQLRVHLGWPIDDDTASNDEPKIYPAVFQASTNLLRAPSSHSADVIPSATCPSKHSPLSGSVVTNAAHSTSPTLARIQQEVEQLSRWLTAVTNFSVHSKVKLGDRFDQDTMIKQLQNAKLATSDGSRTYLPQLYHPAALLLKTKQILTELNARKPQLDRISVEKDRMVILASEESVAAEFDSRAEHLPKFWDATEERLTQRAIELEVIMAETQRLKELERDVDRWITKTELELDGLEVPKVLGSDSDLNSPRRLPVSPDTSRRRLQELDESVPTGRSKLNQYCRECEALVARFRTENADKIRLDLEQMTERWNKLNERLKHATRLILTEASYDDLASDTERVVTIKGKRTPSKERAGSVEKPDFSAKLEHIEQQVARIAQMEADIHRQYCLKDEPLGLGDQRANMVAELQSLQSEISHLFNQIPGNQKPSNTDQSVNSPEAEFLTRWRNLQEQVVTLRHSVQSGPSQSSLFLARLKELNDWVAHQDAAFRAIASPLNGNLLFILKLREILLNITSALESKRSQIEETLYQGRAQFEEERDEQNLHPESELESDGSEFGHGSIPMNTDTTGSNEDQPKRVLRRIRRHLYYLRKRWTSLNANVYEYKQQLDSLSERLSNFQTMFNDAVEQIRSAHTVTLRWIPVDCLPLDHLVSEMEQAQSFYEACVPLTILMNDLDRQLTLFQDSQIAMEPSVIAQHASLRNDLEQVRYVTEARIHTLNQALTIPFHEADQLPTQPFSMLRSGSQKTNVMFPRSLKSAEVVEDQSMVQATPMVTTVTPVKVQPTPLHDSVALPWERCVHPSGTQVPYYKNHASQDTQWDHPLLCDLVQSLKQLDVVRFSEYRTALKLRKLQKMLCLDSLSISNLAENLKHIGHLQAIGGLNTDPFDRTINVPQMIDCLLQLYRCSNANFIPSKVTTLSSPKRSGPDLNDYSNTTSEATLKSSTLPPTTRQIDIKRDSTNHPSPTKCGRGFRRNSSSSRTQRAAQDSYNTASSETTACRDTKADRSPGESRSSSLPETMINVVNSPTQHRSSLRRTGSAKKSKRRFLTGPAKHPINVCVDLSLNWLLNVYDRMRKGNIRALSFKIALTTMCVANLDEKYRYLFGLIADSNGCVTEQRLSALLYECILIPRNLGEGTWAGKEDFTNTVKMCFNQVMEIAQGTEAYPGTPPHFNQGIPVRHFLTWLRLGTPSLSWLPLLHRIMLAEQVVHNIRCVYCQRQPLVGLRYRCLWCLNFDLCQNCFFSGRTPRNHKLTHPMQEYCTNSTSSDSFRDFTRIVRNRLRSRDRASRADDNEAVTGSNANHGNRGRSRCCDTNTFAEGKPRLAPKYGPDLSTLIPRDQTIGQRQAKRTSFRTDSTESTQPYLLQSELPRVSVQQITRPMSSQIHAIARDVNRNYLPPRAASDTRQFPSNNDYNVKSGVKVSYSNGSIQNITASIEPGPHDEHRLIAQFSQELRQRSEPDLNPNQPLTTPMQSPTVPPLMDRSTISDGLPSAGINLNSEFVQSNAGHLSLDRRQLNRTPVHAQLGSYGGGQQLDPTRSCGRLVGEDISSPLGYNQFTSRPDAQFNPYLLSSNPALLRTAPYNSYGPSNIQRSYSLHARSQPPPELPMHSLRLAQVDVRSPWFSSGQQSLPGLYSPSDQRIHISEEERQHIQSDYARLHLTPNQVGYNSATPTQMSARQRFTRMPVQLHQTANPSADFPLGPGRNRGYDLPRLPLHRPPSAGASLSSGPHYTGITTLPGRFNYSGSLGRSAGSANDSSYRIDNYGSEPRVATHPYGPTTDEFQSATSTATGGGVEMANEARLLRAHRGRLELRMQQLEDQNKQLEHKLQRLRQYLVSGGVNSAAGPVGTNGGSVGHITTDLLTDRVDASSKSSLRQRSASGGLSIQRNLTDDKSFRGSGSVGHLRTPTPSTATKLTGSKASRDTALRSTPDTRRTPVLHSGDFFSNHPDGSQSVTSLGTLGLNSARGKTEPNRNDH